MTPSELQSRRHALGLTQAALAAKLGVQMNTVSRWEQGVMRIPAYLHLALDKLDDHAIDVLDGKR